MAQPTKWLLSAALLVSLGTSGMLWHAQRTELAALRRELQQLPSRLESEKPSRSGMGWSREQQDMASEIARQVTATLPTAASESASGRPALAPAPVAAAPAPPPAEVPPGARDVGDVPPTQAEQAAFDAAEALIDGVLRRGTLTRQETDDITELRRKNGNRPEFFQLRERLIVAFNHQQLKLEDDSGPHAQLP